MTSPRFDTRKLIEICRSNDVPMVGVFGSVARGHTTARSHVDLLVRFSLRKSLLALVALGRQVPEPLRRNIDLVTEAAISPYLCQRILGGCSGGVSSVMTPDISNTLWTPLPGLRHISRK